MTSLNRLTALAVACLGSVDKLIGPEASGGDMYEAEVAC